MLTENTLETLRSLKLHGMAQALEHQRGTPDTHALAFEERFGLLVDRERLYRQNGRYRGLLREARLKGYEGDSCGECGNFTLVRNGTCLKCNTCGATSGPSATINLMQLFQQQYRIIGSFGSPISALSRALDRIAGRGRDLLTALEGQVARQPQRQVDEGVRPGPS